MGSALWSKINVCLLPLLFPLLSSCCRINKQRLSLHTTTRHAFAFIMSRENELSCKWYIAVFLLWDYWPETAISQPDRLT